MKSKLVNVAVFWNVAALTSAQVLAGQNCNPVLCNGAPPTILTDSLEMEQHVAVTFGKCSVSGNLTTCYIALTGRKAGTTQIAIKAFDTCLHEDCPGEVSAKLHFSYAIRAYSVVVSQ